MKQYNFKKSIAIVVLILMAFTIGKVNGQLVDVKKWTGTYPDMEDSYPLSFIAFKGNLIPIPHLFIRTWPSHYYIELISLPVTDATEISGEIKTGFLRIAAKMLERHQMKGRYSETGEIKVNTELQKEIDQKLFDSASDELIDIYRLADGFVHLYKKLGQIGQLENTTEVKQIYRKEADELLLRFLMVNFLETNHGEKMEAFAEIRLAMNHLEGELDYTYGKIHFFNAAQENAMTGSYVFLTE
jgi:hypothetical protein